MENDNSKEYFFWLALDSTIREFENEISPLFERNENEWILSRIESILKDNISAMKDLLNESDDIDLRKSLELIDQKIDLFYKIKNMFLEKEKIDGNMEMHPEPVKLLFARNELGKIMIEGHIEDIKSFNDDKYKDLIELLIRLESGKTTFNVEKQKMLSNNRNYKGIYELKGFQVRLIYMREKDYTVVIGALIKKDDKSTLYKDALLNMKNKSEIYRKMIRNGTLDFDKELEYSRDYFNRLVDSVKMGK